MSMQIQAQLYIVSVKDCSPSIGTTEFTVDISNVPVGKNLVIVKDDKQYLTPKK